jgi:uncharacterized protein YndB with AHSA1/START domain
MPEITHLVRICAPRERVFAALVTVEDVRRWWAEEAELDPHVGGRGVFSFAGGEVVTTIRIEALEAPARAVWKALSSNAPGGWEGTEISFVLRADEAGTILRFAHYGFREADDGFARVSTGWAHHLTSLQRYLETGEGTPARACDGSHHAPRAGPRAVTDGETVLACVDLPAAPERVFRALNSEEVERWWGSPETYRMTDWGADMRVGGSWSVNVRHGENVNPASGVFTIVDPPHRVAFSRIYEWPHPTLGWVETKVIYSCAPTEKGARLTVRHDGFVGRIGAAEEHAAGWERTLTWLETYLRREIQPRGDDHS